MSCAGLPLNTKDTHANIKDVYIHSVLYEHKPGLGIEWGITPSSSAVAAGNHHHHSDH